MVAEIDVTSKGLLGAFTLCTLGSGIATLAYGFLLLIQYVGVEYNYGQFSIFATSIVLISIGGLLIITVVLGVFGALKDVSTLRMITIGLLLIFFLILAIFGSWAMFSLKTGRLEKSIDGGMKHLKEKPESITDQLKKEASYLNENYNCCVLYNSEENQSNTLQDRCSAQSGGDDNTENKTDLTNVCIKSYVQTKSNIICRLSIVALGTSAAVLIALLLYAILSQRARAGYAAVSRGIAQDQT